MDALTFGGNDDVDFFVSSTIDVDGQSQLLLRSDERKILVLMKDLEQTCLLLRKYRGNIFRCEDGKGLVCSDLGGRFLGIVASPILQRIELTFPEYRLNPFVKAAVDAIELFDAGRYARNLKAYERAGKIQSIADRLNKVVDEIRGKLKCDSLKSAYKNHQRGATEARKVLTKLVGDVFRKYAKVLVVRLDLSYKKTSKRPLDQQNLNHSDVGRNLRKLLKNLKEKLFKVNLITYAWKLEYGPLRGYHYHVFFFFDGSKCRQDIDMANQIGEHWASVITQGGGSYFNCNAIQHKYPSPGIGMIDHRDWWKIDNLKNKALEYLIKVDYYIRPIADRKIRTFGTGAMLKSRTSKRGRPRGGSPIEFGLRSRMVDSVLLKD